MGQSNQEEVSHFSLETAFFCSFRVWARGFHDLLREKHFLFILLGWGSICITFLVVHSICPDFLASMLVS